MASPARSASPARYERLLVWCGVLAVAAAAWLYLFGLHHRMPAHAGNEAAMLAAMTAPWTAADLVYAFVMWVVMMAAMMAGPVTPALLLFAGMCARSGRAPLMLSTFALGYAIVWTGFSAVAALAQWTLHNVALLTPSMSAATAPLAGAIMVGAGLYQWTPLKNACLRHCRSPLGFFMTNWRDGATGALRMGLRHGAYCLGCCWALMAVLFAVGVMNLVWVATLTLLVLLEKTLPAGTAIARIAGAAMIVAGGLLVGGLI